MTATLFNEVLLRSVAGRLLPRLPFDLDAAESIYQALINPDDDAPVKLALLICGAAQRTGTACAAELGLTTSIDDLCLEYGIERAAALLTTGDNRFPASRCRMIAITEINSAQNFAMLIAGLEYQKTNVAKASKRLKKIIVLGPNPCEVCIENSEEILNLDEEYSNGGYGPSFHTNCMCELALIES